MASPCDGVSLRTVKLKVLYTFDAEQKDNHLARWPHSLEVQTAFVDEATQIGVIDLRTCLEAVTTASPELTNQLDGDFTVYAYDYSEPETPLVGQGMLSKALAVQESGVGTDTEAMVTGRITKNVMGLFSKNAQETLEVKLRLTPLNAFPHPRYRSGSVSSQNGVLGQWSAVSQSSNSSITPQCPGSASPMDTSGLEAMQRMLNEGGTARDRSGSFAAADNPPYPPIPSRVGSRSGTPTLAPAYNPPAKLAPNPMSRPSSRAGERQGSVHARRDSFNAGYFSGDENMEEGPVRKRAKITKVDWPSKSNLNIERQPESLRVVASTASSVRIYRPMAINPAITTAQPSGQAEEVRPPTPIPNLKSGKPRGRPRKMASSHLIRDSRARDSSPAVDSIPPPELAHVSLSSPDESRARSVSSTPANLPSSPPMIPDHPPITSPALPPMMGPHDSGFMSGSLDDLFGDDQMLQFEDFIVDKPGDDLGDQEFPPPASVPPPVFEEGKEVEEAIFVPPAPPLAPAPMRPLSRTRSFTPAPPISMSSPRLAPAPIPRARQILEEQKARTLAQAASAPTTARSLPRSNTWAPESDALTSDAAAGDEARPKPKKRVGKEQTRARLENAIANGEMPPYCDNCGAIETPAWRRAYTKVFDCPWDEVETSLDHGACCYKEVMERNADGSIKTFKGYKVEKRPDDKPDEWVQVSLCNPCGLWFHKQKCPRPREKWQKKDPKEKRKRKRAPKGSKSFQRHGATAKSDAATPGSDESSPTDSATEAPDGDDIDPEGINNDDEIGEEGEPQLPPMPLSLRASGTDPGPRGLHSSHHPPSTRQVQSSPGQAHGQDRDAPIEIGLTPKPVRRQLFPSPDKVQIQSSPVQVAAANIETPLPRFLRRSPRLNKTKDVFAAPLEAAGVVELSADGKENTALNVGGSGGGDDLDEFLDEASANVEVPPSTPTPKRRSERLLLKTPSSKNVPREFGLDISPNIRQSPGFRTPQSKQHIQHPVAAALLGTARKDRSEMTPFTRSIHEALSDAPEFGIISPSQSAQAHRASRSSKKSTPNKDDAFHFPDLPSLKGSSPVSNSQLFNFNFSEISTEHLHTDFNDVFSTDVPMPSSPPPGFFNFINADVAEGGEIWGDLEITNHAPTTVAISTYPDPEAASLVPAPSYLLRRSPRKRN